MLEVQSLSHNLLDHPFWFSQRGMEGQTSLTHIRAAVPISSFPCGR
jgi:hypothetical protein